MWRKYIMDNNEKNSLVKKAYNFYIEKKYKDALNLYIKLSKKIGYNFFRSNIQLCKQKLNINKKISIIIAVYNSEKYIIKCLDSLINQSFNNFEIICIDDGSTDNSLNILRNYEEKYDFISVYEQKNKYAGIARNKGLKYANGEYLLFLDSDDFFEKNMLDSIYTKAQQTQSDVIVFNAQEYDDVTHEFNQCKFPLSAKLFPDKECFSPIEFGDKLFQANSCIAWNKLIKKDIVLAYNLKFGDTQSSNDTLFIYPLLTIAKKNIFNK